ncbi:hypothetical protein D3C84_793450 [compost metagenome]
MTTGGQLLVNNKGVIATNVLHHRHLVRPYVSCFDDVAVITEATAQGVATGTSDQEIVTVAAK